MKDSTSRLVDNALADLRSGHSVTIVAFSVSRLLYLIRLLIREARLRSIPCRNGTSADVDAPRIYGRRFHQPPAWTTPRTRVHFDASARFDRGYSTPSRSVIV